MRTTINLPDDLLRQIKKMAAEGRTTVMADAPEHERYRDWLAALLRSDAAYGVSDLVLNGFLRWSRILALRSPSSGRFRICVMLRSRLERRGRGSALG